METSPSEGTSCRNVFRTAPSKAAMRFMKNDPVSSHGQRARQDSVHIDVGHVDGAGNSAPPSVVKTRSDKGVGDLGRRIPMQQASLSYQDELLRQHPRRRLEHFGIQTYQF